MKFKIKAEERNTALALQIVNLMNKHTGDTFNANFTGAWDRNDCARARLTKINRGKGAEDAVIVTNADGVSAIYIGPFSIDTFPDKDTMLCFYCDEAWFFDLA